MGLTVSFSSMCSTESLAYDWVSHNLYWTDSFWARIEVMDLNSTERGEVLRTGANTVPRGIVVDPVNRQVLYYIHIIAVCF